MSADLAHKLRNPKLVSIAGPVVMTDVESLLDDASHAADRIDELERIVAHQQERIEDGKRKAKKRRLMVSATMKKEALVKEENRILRSQVESLTQDLENSRASLRKLRKLMEATSV